MVFTGEDTERYLSWGRVFRYKHEVRRLFWLTDDFKSLMGVEKKVLPYGLGRSYGDSCLNDGGVLIDASGLNHLIFFDRTQGIIRCEAGISLAAILEIIVPAGWFLPVTPGTKFVTLGGAIANDVHGKNHHSAGTIGCFVNCLELARSGGEKTICSLTKEPDLFAATIGGMGLTGLITWAEIRLKKASPMVRMESIKFKNLDKFFELVEDDKNFEYTVAWVDCTAKGSELGRGIYMRGNHTEADPRIVMAPVKHPILTVPCDAPNFLLNNYTVRAFNVAYYGKQRREKVVSNIHYNPFFYPLDIVNHWNRIYGSRGFYQYQFVIPSKNADVIPKVFELIADSKLASFLAVLKKFGSVASPGMMSFPKEGITLALDFVNMGEATQELFAKLDDIVLKSEGRLYPAKDSHMSSSAFKTYYPNLKKFQQFIDPQFSSSFYRRVIGDE